MADEGNGARSAARRLEPLGKGRGKVTRTRVVIGSPRASGILASPRAVGKLKAMNVPQVAKSGSLRNFGVRKMSIRELRLAESGSPHFRPRIGSDPRVTVPENIKKEKPLRPSIQPRSVSATIQRCYSHTQIGTVGSRPKAENQDSIFYVHVSAGSGEFSMLGVCDGHGVAGHLVSAFVSKELPAIVRKQYSAAEVEEDTWERVMRNSYEECAEQLKLQTFDTLSSGCTCVSIVVHEGQLFCANVGDSRAVLARRSMTGFSAIELSRDQKPDVPEEKQRILEAGGRVEPILDDVGEAYGPPRIWHQSANSPGLAMSRAIGDTAASSLGVIPTPGTSYAELLRLYLMPGDLFVVLASDGIWEFISSQEAVNLVQECVESGLADQCCERLVEEATRRWKREEDCVDDITVIVAFLESR